MKSKRFLKKLSAVIVGFFLGVSSVASVGAISPINLWEKIDSYRDKASILNDYESFIKPNLLENGFGESNVGAAKNFLNSKTVGDDAEGLSRFKCYAYHRLLLAQSEILVTQQDIDSKMLDLEKDNPVSTILKTLEENSSIIEVKQEIENIRLCLKNCQSIYEMVLVDCPLKYVRQQQQIFYKNYCSLHSHIKSALNHIKTCQANRQKKPERAEKANLHLNFANSYSDMMSSTLTYGFGCFL